MWRSHLFLPAVTGLLTVTGRGVGMGAMPEEWTQEAAARCWKPMVRPVAHVGVPGFEFQAAVMWDGALVFGPLGFRELEVMQAETARLGPNLLHLSVGFGTPMRLVDRKGSSSPAIRRWLAQGRLPVPTVETRDGDLVWQETAFAHLLDRPCQSALPPRADDMLVVHVLFQVRNTGYAERTAHLWLHPGTTSEVGFGYKCRQGAALAPPIPYTFEPPYVVVPEGVRMLVGPPPTGRLQAEDDATGAIGVEGVPTRPLHWEVPLAPGEEAALRLVIPYGVVDRATAAHLSGLDSDRVLADVTDYWRRIVNGPGQITTADPFLNDYLAAVAGQMAQQVAWRGHTDLWMYKTSPNHYEGYWPCNAAKALPVLGLRGLPDLERPVLRGFVQCQTDDVGGLARGPMGQGSGEPGAEGFARLPGFLGNFGEWTANPLLLSHGLGMWALAGHFRTTRDRQWLGEGPGSPLQTMLDACDWVAQQRRRTMREEGGTRVPYWGLLPAASAHDWLAGNTIFNDAFCIYGMAEVVRLLREIGHPRAEEMAAELGDYRACLHDRYAEARDRARPVPLADGATLPFVPRMVQELDWTMPDWTYTGYGPLRAGAWGALDPNDELVDQSLAFLEAGMPRGEGPYFGAHIDHPDTADANWADVSDREAERHYLWRHYVEYETMWPVGWSLFLARDDLPRFFEWLFHTLAVCIHRDWRVGVESLDGVPSCAPGDAERWQAVRAMFVNERGGYDGSEQSLWLLQAIPRSWLRPGQRLAVREMGTRFGGRVDLDVEVAEDGDSVAVRAALNLKVRPTEVRLRVRSGDGRPLRTVTVNGADTPVLDGDTIRLRNTLRGRYEVVGTFG